MSLFALRPGAADDKQRALVALIVEPGPSSCAAAAAAAATAASQTTSATSMLRGRTGRRALQALGLVLATAYATVLLYQAVAPSRQWLDEEASTDATSLDVVVGSGGAALEVPLPLLRLFAARSPRPGDRPVVAREPLLAAEEATAAAPPVYATATMAPFSTDLDDLFISVKTSKNYHYTRLPDVIDTWFQHAKKQTWFFTDRDDPYFQNQTNGHMINTNCSPSHHRRALCCKMSVEFDRYLESGKKWFCHFDDDNYVNVPRLVKLLDNYNPREDWYLGKPSIPHPLEVYLQNSFLKRSQKIGFWFATGGAGFCISRALALKMIPVAGGGKFITVGDRIRLPDDVTMGYIIEHLLKKKLTVVEQFHSHLEALKFLNKDTFHDQISFSYSKGLRDDWNTVKIDGFSAKDDPKRFRSLHCHLFPNVTNCPHR